MSRSSLNTVKIKAARPRKRATYHHGDLRSALIAAADGIIAQEGIEGFSLRAAAKRAGVSQSAPAHHFGSAKGLLTEVALLAYQRLGEYLENAGRSDDPAKDMRTVSLAFVRFALDHPGHFRLMFRHDLVDRSHPRYEETRLKPGTRFDTAVAAYHGKAAMDLERFEDAADFFGAMSTVHGLAHLVLAEKGTHLFEHGSARAFVEKDLPKVLTHMYPSRAPQAMKRKSSRPRPV